MTYQMTMTVIVTGPTKEDAEGALASLIDFANDISNSEEGTVTIMDPHEEGEAPDSEKAQATT